MQLDTGTGAIGPRHTKHKGTCTPRPYTARALHPRLRCRTAERMGTPGTRAAQPSLVLPLSLPSPRSHSPLSTAQPHRLAHLPSSRCHGPSPLRPQPRARRATPLSLVPSSPSLMFSLLLCRMSVSMLAWPRTCVRPRWPHSRGRSLERRLSRDTKLRARA